MAKLTPEEAAILTGAAAEGGAVMLVKTDAGMVVMAGNMPPLADNADARARAVQVEAVASLAKAGLIVYEGPWGSGGKLYRLTVAGHDAAPKAEKK